MDGSERRERPAARLYPAGCKLRRAGSWPRCWSRAARRLDLVQLRAKDAGDAEILAAAAEARSLCTAAGALLRLVNDRPDLAVAAGADGVHVGQDDMTVADARAITARSSWSVSNLNDLTRALRPIVCAGDEMELHLVKEGRDPHQAVGYLPDGTMIVINHARSLIGKTVKIVVSSTLQTAGGRLFSGN